MHFAALFAVWPFTPRKVEARVITDADALMKIWGETADKVAANMAWREDIGLIKVSEPGHWTRVTEEIGRRLCRDDMPAVDVSLRAA